MDNMTVCYKHAFSYLEVFFISYPGIGDTYTYLTYQPFPWLTWAVTLHLQHS